MSAGRIKHEAPHGADVIYEQKGAFDDATKADKLSAHTNTKAERFSVAEPMPDQPYDANSGIGSIGKGAGEDHHFASKEPRFADEKVPLPDMPPGPGAFEGATEGGPTAQFDPSMPGGGNRSSWLTTKDGENAPEVVAGPGAFDAALKDAHISSAHTKKKTPRFTTKQAPPERPQAALGFAESIKKNPGKPQF